MESIKKQTNAIVNNAEIYTHLKNTLTRVCDDFCISMGFAILILYYFLMLKIEYCAPLLTAGTQITTNTKDALHLMFNLCVNEVCVLLRMYKCVLVNVILHDKLCQHLRVKRVAAALQR